MEHEPQFTMGSLFSGSGGFELASTLCGIEPVWCSEIEPFPIKVTKARFPNMKHYGDISTLNGADLEPVDLITGGSPCQDMSVAGKRQGMSKQCPNCGYTAVSNTEDRTCPECGAELEYTRSGLFMEQIRVVKEMREKYGKPRFMLWENVTGAFSSNGGEDFRAVLEETARIKDKSVVIPRPEKGKWQNAGLIVGDGYSIAWRVLDAQYWGVPQRRRRIALVADFGGECAGEILFKREGLCRNFTESRKAWQGVARGSEKSIGEAGRNGITAGFCTEHSAQARGIGYEEEISPTLRAGVVPACITEQYAVDFGRTADRIQMNPDKSVTLQGEGGGCGAKTGLYCLPKEPYVMNERQYACTVTEGKANTLTGTDYKGTQCVFQPVADIPKAYSINHQGGNTEQIIEGATGTLTASMNSIGNNKLSVCYGIGSYDSNAMKSDNPHAGIYEAETSRTLDLNGGNPACNQGGIAVCEPVAYGIDRAAFNQGENALYDFSIEEEMCQTLVARGPNAVAETKLCRMEAFGQYSEDDKCSAMKARDYKDVTDIVIEPEYIVRRLTPLECARLQGFPDWWTDGIEIENPSEEELCFWREVFETHRKLVTGASKPKTDKQIIKWLSEGHNDGAEYKLWGNGIALPCFLYVMEGIANVLNKERCDGQPLICEFQRGVCCYPIEDCENCPVRKGE